MYNYILTRKVLGPLQFLSMARAASIDLAIRQIWPLFPNLSDITELSSVLARFYKGLGAKDKE